MKFDPNNPKVILWLDKFAGPSLGDQFFLSVQIVSCFFSQDIVIVSFSDAKAAQEAQMSVRPSVRSSGYFNFDSL